MKKIEMHLYKIDNLFQLQGKGNRAELGREIGVSRQAINRIIKDNSTRPETLAKIADYFNVPLEYFHTKDMTYEQALSKKKQNVQENSEKIKQLENKIDELKDIIIKMQSKLLS